MPGDDDAKYISDVAPTTKALRVPSDDEKSALDLIAKYESRNQNTPNYRFDPRHTAQGYHQITNTNWRSFGPRAGVDLNQYPNAMAAPRDVQESVAGLMYSERGFQDWAPFNPRLRKAVASGELNQSADSKYISAVPDDDAKYVSGGTQQPLPNLSSGMGGVRTAQGRRSVRQQPANPVLPGLTSGMGGMQTPPPAPRPEPFNVREFVRKGRQAENALQYDPDVIRASWSDQPQPTEMAAKVKAAQQLQGQTARREFAASTPNVYTDSGMPTAVRALVEPLAKGYAGIAQTGAGAAGYLGDIAENAVGAPGGQGTARIARKAERYLGDAATQTLTEAQTADERRPLQGVDVGRAKYAIPALAALQYPAEVGDVGAGFISSAPAVLAMEAGVPAPVAFGAQGALSARGRGATSSEQITEAALGIGQGSLFEVPLGRFGRTAAVGAGTYGLDRLAGVPSGEAAKSSAVNALFAALGAGRESEPKVGPTVESRAAAPMEPAVEFAARSAFDRAGISPEAQEKATRIYNQPTVPERVQGMRQQAAAITQQVDRAQMNAAVQDAEQQRAVSTNPQIEPPRDVADYWKIRHPDGTTEGFHSQAEAEAALASFQQPDLRQTPPPAQSFGAKLIDDLLNLDREQAQAKVLEGLPKAGRTEPIVEPPVEPAEAPPTVTDAGRTYQLRDGEWWLTSGEKAIRVSNASTIAELNRRAGRFSGQGGFMGERPEQAPEMAGVKVGAAEDLAAERRPVDIQPRQLTGEFTSHEDYKALHDELLRFGNQQQTLYRTLASHPARRNLAAASGTAVRDYFRQLHRFVAVNAPDKLSLVEQAEAAEAAGDNVKAIILSERALHGTHEFINKLSGAVLATDAMAKGVELPAARAANWRDTLAEVRERTKRAAAWERQRGSVQGEPVKPPPIGAEGMRSGAVADIGREAYRQSPFGVSRADVAETTSDIKADSGYDLRAKPLRGVADPTEVAKAAVPIYDQLRAEASRKIASGELDPARYTTFVRTALNSRLLTEGWHKANERAAYKIVTDLAKQETYDPATSSFRTIPSQTSRFVDAAPLNFRIDSTDRTTARDLRREYSGAKNAQIVIGNNLAKQMKAEVKDELGRQAIYFNLAAGGDKAVLRIYLANPAEELNPYRPALERALALKPWEQKWANTLRQGYDELGDYSRSLGTIRNVKENYHNRLYVQEKAGKDFVKSEAFRRGLNAYTSHGKQQVYANVLDAVLGKLPDGSTGTPKKLAVTDAADAYSILNEEMARANTNAKFREAMAASGLGREVPAGRIPDGYTALPNMGREIPLPITERLHHQHGWGWSQLTPDGAMVLRNEFVVPDGIAKGLRAVTNIDSNHPFINKVNEIQGRIKTLDLALSAFHHLAMLHTLLAQTYGGLGILSKLPKMHEWARSGELNAAEQDFVRHTGMTTRVESNADIMRKLTEGDDVLARAIRLPIVKQTFQLAEKSSDFLFDNIQRKMKVLDYANKAAAWIGDHPDATDRQITAAKRSLASEINAAYGGLNWTALGVSKADLGLLRLTLLAPDWTLSNVLLPLKLAAHGEENAAGRNAALQHLITSTIGSTIATVGLNHILHGDTDKARKLLAEGKTNEAAAAFYGQPEIGHELEVEIAPGVYLPMFRGGISDIVKAIQLYRELGPARGSLQFVSNKLAPFPRTVVGALSNTVMGKPLLVPYNPSNSWMANTLAQLKQTGQMLRPAIPVPLGVSQAYHIATGGKPTAAGIAVALSGAGRVTSDRGPRTEAEKYMYRLSQLEGKPIYEEGTDAETKYQLKSSLVDKLRKGENVDKAVDKAAEAGDLGADDIRDIYKGGDANLFAERFKKLKLDNAIDVYKLADDDERKLIDDNGLLWKKVEGTLPKLSPNEQQKVLKRLEEVEKLEAKPAKSVGVSRAQELGVPMPIPPRGAAESDVAYRARLLQLGRARSAKLDEVASSADFGTLNNFGQRKTLYNALASSATA